jgi:hypothetical protein
MADFANLVIGVNTAPLKRGEKALKDTTKASAATERAVKGTGRGFDKAGRSASAATPKVAAFGAATKATRGMALGATQAMTRMVIGLGAVIAAGAGLNKFISATVESDASQAQLAAAILSTGGAANRTIDQLNQNAAALQGVTKFGDEATNAMQGVLLTFTQIQGGVFDHATVATMDLATAMGTDLKSAALQVGKALNDPVLGMTALSRSGIQFTDAQKDIVKGMVATNDIAGAQAIILAELDKQFGGSAAAARDTLGGAFSALGNAFGDLFEVSKDGSKALRAAVEGLLETISDPKFVAAIQSLGVAMFGMAEIAMQGIQGIVGAFQFFGQNIDFALVAVAGLATGVTALTVSSLAAMTTGMTAAGIATGVFTGAVNLARVAIIALGGPLGIVWGILGSAAAAWVLFGQKTDTATSAVEEGRIAIALLNESLDSFSQVESPAAQGAALGNAVAYKAQAQAALEVARAEMIKIQAMNASAEQRLTENGAVMPFGTEAGRQRASDAAAVVSSMNDALVEADKRIKAVAVTISGQQIPATAKATKVVTDLSNSLGDGKKSLDTSAKDAAAALKKAEAEAKALQDAIDKPMITAIDGLSNAFGDFVAGGLKDFKGFAQSVLSTFASMLSQMIAMAVRNKIMIGLGIGGGGGVASVANAATGGGGGILSSLGGLGGGKGILGSIASKGIFGAGGVFGSMGSSLGTSIGGALAGPGSALATSLGGIGASIGSIVPIIGIAAAAFSFFKKKTTELGSGVRLTVDGMSASADKFSIIQTKRFWGLSKKISKSFSALDASVSGPLEKSLEGIFSGISGTALSLGVGAAAFDRFSAQVEVSTKGLSESEANAAIKTALDELANNFAGMIPGLRALQKAGERTPDTLTRIATSLAVVNDVFGNLGFTLYNASISGAGAAASFAELFGTVDDFVKSTASYYDAFFTADEKRDAATARLSASLDALGIGAIPDDRAAFRDLVEQAQAAGNDGLTAALIMLSPSFADLTASVDELSQVMRNQVQERNFATGVDFRRGLSRASNGVGYTPKDSAAEMLVELKALNARVDMLQSTSEFTAANTGATANNTEDQLTVLETTT